MKAPVLEENNFSVLSDEYNTGIVLTVDFERFIGKGEVYHTFNSYEIALEFVDKIILQNPDLEFSIYDHQGKWLITKDLNGKR